MTMPRIAARALNTPLMMHPHKAAAIAAGLGARMTGQLLEFGDAPILEHVAFAHGRPSMGVIGDRLGRAYDARARKPYDMVGGVAVIPVEGTLVHKGAYVESYSGETSYEGLQTQVSRAMADQSVRGVVLEIDSYGGEVAGAFETAALVHQLAQAKPTIAILTESAYSAGYLLASAARQIFVPMTGGAGSIGVIMMHVDKSLALESAGLKVTILAAGEHKADGNPYEALPEGVAAEWMARNQAVRQIFADTVGKFRGKRFTSAAAMATEARSYYGQDAVKAGLADAAGSPQEVFQAFINTINRA